MRYVRRRKDPISPRLFHFLTHCVEHSFDSLFWNATSHVCCFPVNYSACYQLALHSKCKTEEVDDGDSMLVNDHIVIIAQRINNNKAANQSLLAYAGAFPYTK